MARCLIAAGRFDLTTATLCLRFAEAGYKVVVVAPTAEDGAVWQRRIQELGLSVDIAPSDVQDDTVIRRLVADVPVKSDGPAVLLTHAWSFPDDGSAGLQAWLATASPFARVIHVLENDEVAPDASKVLPTAPNATVNTIVAAHVGASVAPTQQKDDFATSLHQRSGRAYEIAMLAVYLASQEAAHIHGAILTVHTGRYLS